MSGTERCKECWEPVEGPVEALEHYLSEHPISKVLHETLSAVKVKSKCHECREHFSPTVSVGKDGAAGETVLTVPSRCFDCVEKDPLSGLMVWELSPQEVINREDQSGDSDTDRPEEP